MGAVARDGLKKYISYTTDCLLCVIIFPTLRERGPLLESTHGHRTTDAWVERA